MTWDEYAADTPRPGSGRPYRDDEHWDFKGTTHFTDEERVRYEAKEERYRQDHGECGSHRHSVSGSLTMHCGKCRPPPRRGGRRHPVGISGRRDGAWTS